MNRLFVGVDVHNAMHITASVFINDDEGGFYRDYARWLEELAPHEPVSRYLHNRMSSDIILYDVREHEPFDSPMSF